jgi:acetyl esterase/lipase
MDWMLALLALFNAVSMYALHLDRQAARVEPPWFLFAFSVVASELAWIWLPIQVVVAEILIWSGALSSILGIVALLVLLASWVYLGNSIRLALRATQLTEAALQQGLGANYRDVIPPQIQAGLEVQAPFKEWRLPFKMRRPGVERIRNISYGPGGIKHKLDIYRPTHIPDGGCPVLLQIHGGAWMMGSKEQQALPLMNFMASKGWICVSINYRLSPSVGFPAHIEDCKRALRWIRTQGQEYGMNPDFVAVTGGSAGGHLTALMGLTANLQVLQQEFPDVDTTVQAAVPFYGIYDFLARFEHSNGDLFVRFARGRVVYESPEENPELWELASPVSHVSTDSPPFMIVQGEIDSLANVRGTHVFQQKLQDASNNPVVYLELPGAEHGFDGIHSPRTDAVIKGVHRFLEWSRAQHASKPSAVEAEAEPAKETDPA